MKHLIILILSASTFFLGCYNAEQESKFSHSDTAEAEYTSYEEQQEDGSSQQPNITNTKVNDKKIIRTAQVEIEVSDYKKSRESLNTLLKEYDAIIQQEQEQNLSYRLENNLTIRLAPEKLDAFIQSLEGVALNIFNKTINSRDVTKEFIDMETRLTSKRAVIQRYQELLKQAKDVEDILAVEAQLRLVIEEVESVEGQLKYLRDQVGLSTVHLTMYEKLEQSVHQKRGFFSRLGRSVGDGWSGFLEFLIGVATLWPFWILLLVLFILFKRYRKK